MAIGTASSALVPASMPSLDFTTDGADVGSVGAGVCRPQAAKGAEAKKSRLARRTQRAAITEVQVGRAPVRTIHCVGPPKLEEVPVLPSPSVSLAAIAVLCAALSICLKGRLSENEEGVASTREKSVSKMLQERDLRVARGPLDFQRLEEDDTVRLNLKGPRTRGGCVKPDTIFSTDDGAQSSETQTDATSHPLHLLAAASIAFAEATLDPKRLVELIVRELADAIGDNCVIFLLDPEGQWLRAQAFFTRYPEQDGAIRSAFSDIPIPIGEGIFGKVAATRNPVWASNLDASPLINEIKPEYRNLYQKYPAYGLLAVPLLARQRCVGVLALSRQASREPYSRDQLRLAQDLGERAAMAIEIAQLLEAERAAAAKATALANVSKAIQTLELGEVIAAIVHAGADLIGDACVLTLVEDGLLRAKFAAHPDPAAEGHMKNAVEEFTPQGSVAARAVRENRSIRVENAAALHFESAASQQFKKEFGITSLLICPLRVEGSAIGTLGLSRGTGGAPYTGADEAFLQELADRAALVIHNARLYETARAARKEAETAIVLKDQFLSAASHELRTPLTTVQLTLQGILAAREQEGRASGSDWSVAALSTAERETARLVHLVDDLLDVSRLAAGRLGFDVQELDLCDLVRSVVGRFETQAEEAGCSVSFVSPASLRGSWDPKRIDQVVTNLLTNAIKFGRGQPITVSVSELEGRARITVADSGVGISAEDHERIFERFERTEPARNYRGVGVGLWLVRELVQAMGGSVRVQSRLGEGATFLVEVPR
jgi:signal transduction histidine kinase